MQIKMSMSICSEKREKTTFDCDVCFVYFFSQIETDKQRKTRIRFND